jgi:hypothetical protein
MKFVHCAGQVRARAEAQEDEPAVVAAAAVSLPMSRMRVNTMH